MRVAAAQAGQAPGLRERAEDEQPRDSSSSSPSARVARLGVDEVAQRLVEQDDDALGQRRRAARRSAVDAEQLAGRVVGVAQRDDARAVVDRREDRLDAEARDRHRVAAGAPGHGGYSG